MKKLILFLTVIAMTNFVHAQTYYVSNTSGGTNQGTQANPWTSLASINWGSVAAGGRSLLLKKGDVFNEAMSVGVSGSAGNPIVIGSYGTGAKPVISGFATISSWNSIGGGIYESVVSSAQSTLNMVLRDNTFQPIGRWPKVTDANSGYKIFQSHIWTSPTASNSITSNQIASALNYVGGQVVVRTTHWLLNKGTITAQNSTTVTHTEIAGTGGTYEPANNYGFFFQNHVNTLTALGEWCYESSTKKLKMYFGAANPASYTIKASVVDNLVTLSSKTYITFDGISFTGSNSRTFNISASSHIKINNCDISYSGLAAVYTSASSSNNISVTNSTISYTNNNAIEAHSATNWTIENNVISNTGMVAGMGTTGDGPHYSAIGGIGVNSLIQNNEINNTGYIPILVNGGNGTIVQNNFINNFCIVKGDGGGIYMGSGNSGAIIRNNIVLNGIGAGNGTPNSRGLASGIYMDDDVSNVQIYGNTVANCIYGGFLLHNTNNISLHDNTGFNNGTNTYGAQLLNLHDSYGGLIRNLNINNNIFVSKLVDQAVMLSATISGDIPLFGTFNYNYYARPIKEIETILVVQPSTVWLSLEQWKTFSGQDAQSKKSPKTITTTNDLRFEYNETSSNKVVNLGATYIGIDNSTYNGTITLAPYSSAVLIYLSGVVTNQLPVANAGSNQTITLPTNSITLNGNGTDADGTITAYQWAKISGPSATIVSPTQAQTAVNNLIQGVYQFQLTVTDNLGATGGDIVVVTVNPALPLPNQPPVANGGPNQTITLPTNSITLNGSGTDPDGMITDYQWTKVAGPSATIVSANQAQTAVNNLLEGVYRFQLTVTDNLGATGGDIVVVTVNPAQPPSDQPLYVSNSSGGTNQGTQANPWTSFASINWATVAINGGILLLKKGDVFNEVLTIGASGSEGNPIVIGSYGTGAKPVINGFETAGSWVSIGGGVYEAVLTNGQSTCNMVTVNGVFQPIGRYPKLAAANSGYLTFQSHSGITSITSNAIASAPSFVGGQVVIRSYHYLLNKGLITNQNSNTVTYTDIPGTYGTYEPTNGYGFFFQNHENTLTALGDWCYVPSTKKLKMYFGAANPNSYTVKASVIENLVSIPSRSYITFDSVAFYGSNTKTIDITTSNNIAFTGCDFKFAGTYGIACSNSGSSNNNISVINCTANYVNDNFIEARSSPNWVIRGNTINYVGSIAGMGVTGDGHYNGLNEIGITSLIEYNTLTHIGYNGIQMNGGGPETDLNSTIIQYNFIDTFCYVKDDGGGIYSQGTGAQKTINSNIVINGIGAPNGTEGYKLGVGIYIADGYGFAIQNNTVANCSGFGYVIHNAHNIGMASNTAYNNGQNDGSGGAVQFADDAYGGPISDIVSINNIFFSKLDNQTIMRIVNPTTNLSVWGNFNRNFYCRPTNETNYIATMTGGGTVWRTLAQWKTFAGNDIDSMSVGSPFTLTSASDIVFHYNNTQVDKIINIGTEIYEDVKGRVYTGNVTIEPFKSVILLRSTNSENSSPGTKSIITRTIPDTEATESRLQVSAYPNPSKTFFNLTAISKSTEELNIAVYNMVGVKVQQIKTIPGQVVRLGDHFVSGTYLIEVKQGIERVITKVVKL